VCMTTGTFVGSSHYVMWQYIRRLTDEHTGLYSSVSNCFVGLVPRMIYELNSSVAKNLKKTEENFLFPCSVV
jgi:hypothetical protein